MTLLPITTIKPHLLTQQPPHYMAALKPLPIQQIIYLRILLAPCPGSTARHTGTNLRPNSLIVTLREIMLFCAFVIGETAARVVQRARGLFSVCAFLLGGFGDGGAAAVGGLELGAGGGGGGVAVRGSGAPGHCGWRGA